MSGYPDYQNFAYTFSRAELALARRIFTAISKVEIDQPTTEAVVKGTRPWPIGRTEGEMDLGEGTVTFTNEAERVEFIDLLGDGYRSIMWDLSWILVAKNKPSIKIAAFGCRVLGNPIAHEGGETALGGDISFSFMSHTINGKSPHLGMISPTR